MTRGVSAATGTLSGAAEAAGKVADLAERAASAGSFGVGGMLVDAEGNILAHAVNAVVQNNRAVNPMAHTERLLVEWAYTQYGLRGLRNLLVVSSLDPCAMCAGAILRSGINVISLANDEISGVHVGSEPHRMPQALWPAAERQFALFRVANLRPETATGHIADEPPAFRELQAGIVPEDAFLRATAAFQTSLHRVQHLVGDQSAGKVRVVTDDMRVGLNHLRGSLPDNFWLPRRRLDVTDRSCRATLAERLRGDASALIDHAGTVILVARATQTASPATTSIIDLVQAYMRLRAQAKAERSLELPHQRCCSIIKLRPPRQEDVAMLEIGAIGSFMEAPHRGSFPTLGYLEADGVDLVLRALEALPPLYNSVIGLTTAPVAAA
jgi:tRNA(Arg) A34 adenosine deaminase TadA